MGQATAASRFTALGGANESAAPYDASSLSADLLRAPPSDEHDGQVTMEPHRGDCNEWGQSSGRPGATAHNTGG